MGLFDFLKKGKGKKGLSYAPAMSGNSPFYSAFGEDIYASDIIVQSIRCKANEFKKLEPRHIKQNDGAALAVMDSDIARLLKRPNPYMTTADFLEKITILLELNKNVFIYPQYYVSNANRRVYTGLYPLKPVTVEYLSDESGNLYIYMSFANGYEVTLPQEDVIHWRKDYGVNDYFGGGMLGGNDNIGLLKMLKRYDQITQGIAKALEVSCSINGILKVASYYEDDAKKAEREKFEKAIQNSKSGIWVTDMGADYTNIPRDVKIVDEGTLKFFYDAILRANGTPLCILNGDYTKAQKEAYYEHALEADIISLGQAMSAVMFSGRETSYGNEIVMYPKDINFMSMENKIAFAQIAVPSGSMLKDEFRAMFGFPPLPDGQGQVIAQGYNLLLDGSNNNTTQSTGEGVNDEQNKTE